MRLVFLICLVLGAVLGLFAAANPLSKSHSWQAFGSFVTRGPDHCPRVALTLDDGPSPKFTDDVLQILKDENARATFFLTGHEAARRPDLVARIARAGHEIGNHSYTHRRMVLMSPLQVRVEIEKTDAILREAGYTGPLAFRPPYGKRLITLPFYLWRRGRPVVLWSLNPEYRPAPADSAEEITQRVLSAAQPGDILLMHVMYQSRAASRRALPLVIRGLREKGLEPVTLDVLMRGDCLHAG